MNILKIHKFYQQRHILLGFVAASVLLTSLLCDRDALCDARQCICWNLFSSTSSDIIGGSLFNFIVNTQGKRRLIGCVQPPYFVLQEQQAPTFMENVNKWFKTGKNWPNWSIYLSYNCLHMLIFTFPCLSGFARNDSELDVSSLLLYFVDETIYLPSILFLICSYDSFLTAL